MNTSQPSTIEDWEGYGAGTSGTGEVRTVSNPVAFRFGGFIEAIVQSPNTKPNPKPKRTT